MPDLYGGQLPLSYWDRFGMPAAQPQYFTDRQPSSACPHWPITTWWMKPGAVR